MTAKTARRRDKARGKRLGLVGSNWLRAINAKAEFIEG
jgi:hypothetical protein